MARQKGVIKLEGRIGDLSFYKSGGDYLARSKGGVDAERIKKDPAFARTRENGAEFGRAGKASKLLRSVFKAPIAQSADNKVASRLTTAMLKVVQADTTNKRGERNVVEGDLNLLKGFEFNGNTSLDEVLKAAYTVAFDRSAGNAQVSVEFEDPSMELEQIDGATEARLTVGVAAINYETSEYEVDVVQSATIDLNSKVASTVDTSASITADSTQPVFVVLGIEYYQTVNGELYIINNKESRSLAMVAVDIP
ncbi:hypothetical protein [Labilibacter marinus]|uniref:hypothetical protein n=1 Tax=Labilibacter marinus TaxID=1477105 RepID=UPI00094F78B2|nr:hypothetical protein [Labilibacter marinus]